MKRLGVVVMAVTVTCTTVGGQETIIEFQTRGGMSVPVFEQTGQAMILGFSTKLFCSVCTAPTSIGVSDGKHRYQIGKNAFVKAFDVVADGTPQKWTLAHAHPVLGWSGVALTTVGILVIGMGAMAFLSATGPSPFPLADGGGFPVAATIVMAGVGVATAGGIVMWVFSFPTARRVQ